MEANREYKSSVFTSFFRNKSRLIELYNAIANTNYPPDTDIQINTLENVLFNGQLNDISFSIEGKLIVMVEHQSTVNLNMPARFLLYIAQIYQIFLAAVNLYGRTLIRIPRPEFIVLYNGKEDIDDKTVLRLSDAFMCVSDQKSLELEVVVYNIKQGSNPQIMSRSRSLADYSAIMAKISEGQTNGESLNEAVRNAVLFGIENGIMVDFLRHYGSEAFNMLSTDFYFEDLLASKFGEGRKEGRKEGMEEGLEKKAFDVARSMLADGLTFETVRKYTGLDELAVLSLR
jgi:predicted transposase/invertase (TIGR01784 family)